MTYKDRIAHEPDLTLDKIIDISEELLPRNLRIKPWENLVHGTELLSTDEQLCCYMLAYGEMHATKCRAAFQNFPFEKLISTVEIVDWGCGQGLATCVALEVLKERGLDSRVKKITLIEPSEAALSRAKINIAQKVSGSASIHLINKYLPACSENADSIENFYAEYPYVIHLFSNILDIPSVDIHKLSRIVVSAGMHNFVLCMGPMNTNQWRLKAFAGYFHGAKLFSNIFSPVYSYTRRTLHSFGCRTQCFEFIKSDTLWDGLNGYETRDNVIDPEYIDDYSTVTKRFAKNKDFSENLLKIYENIYNQQNPTDVLLLRPNISADVPDIVLFRPNVGIVLFDVCEEAIPPDILEMETLPKDPSTEKEQELYEKLKELISKVKSYENRLIDLHIANLREKIFDNSKYLKVIHKVVICAYNTAEQISVVCKNIKLADRNYTDLLSIHDLNNISDKLGINRYCPEFTEELAGSFKKILYSPWHSYKDGRPVNLTSTQANLSVSKERVHYNIVSCAGSGKTEVLVHRAVDANIRTGQPVLILTFNLALRNYIKHRLGLVAADFNWNDFVILNYHEFFNSQAINCGVPVHDLGAYRNLEYFKGHSTKRYASIFIDEAQDYESSWLTILYKHFLKKGGEMILFEDASQDLYHRRVNKETHQIKFEKRLLKKGASSECRFKNDAIFNLVQRFATYFQLGIDEPLTLGLFSNQGVIKNAYVEGRNRNAETYGAWVDNIIKEYGLLRDNCAVIASTHDLLQKIDLVYRNRTGSKTITTFPTDEQHKKMRSMSASAFIANEKSLERTKKLNFSMSNEGLKLSTIYSFKGWEADNIILFIQEPERGNEKYDNEHPKPIELAPARALCPEIIYTAISRARVNLFIINLGNEQYKQFFNENIP